MLYFTQHKDMRDATLRLLWRVVLLTLHFEAMTKLSYLINHHFNVFTICLKGKSFLNQFFVLNSGLRF